MPAHRSEVVRYRLDVQNPEFIVGLVEHLSSDRVVVANIKNDKNLANDGVSKVAGGFFGDRSYSGVVGAIVDEYGSLENFYSAHPNVVVVAVDAIPHAGAGKSSQLSSAVVGGLHDLEERND